MKPTENQLIELRQWLALCAARGVKVDDLERAAVEGDKLPHEAMAEARARLLKVD